MTSRRSGLLILLLIVLAGVPAMLLMREPTDRIVTDAPVGRVYPAEGRVVGDTLGEWHARYWQWLTRFPISESPALDPTGERCGVGQDAAVFFVPSHLPPCTVPAGTPVFVPIAGTECSTLEPPPFTGEDDEALRACAAADAERYTNIAVTVDGEPVEGIGNYRAASPVFTLDLPEANVLAVPAGKGDAAADGYAVMLAPLDAGEHEVVIHVESVDGYALPDMVLQLTVAGD